MSKLTIFSIMSLITTIGFIIVLASNKEYRKVNGFNTISDVCYFLIMIIIPILNIMCLMMAFKDVFEFNKKLENKKIENKQIEEENKRKEINDFLSSIIKFGNYSISTYFNDSNSDRMYNDVFEKIQKLKDKNYHEIIIYSLEDSLYELLKHNEYENNHVSSPGFLESLANLDAVLDKIIEKFEEEVKTKRKGDLTLMEEYNKKSTLMFKSIMESIENNESPL